MNHLYTVLSLVLLLPAFVVVCPADELSDLAGKGTLVFEDDFNRAEADDSKEQLGKKWVTNSQRRAKGVKQGDLVDGVLKITMAKVADHGVSIKHDAPFKDGMVQVRFRMHDWKGIGFNFNDPACKESHAGHICAVGVKPKTIMCRDGKTGIFAQEIRALKVDPANKAEVKKRTKDKFAYEKIDLKTDTWYQMNIVIKGTLMRAFVDGKEVARLDSEGIGHAVKQNMAFAVSGTADVDDLKVWKF